LGLGLGLFAFFFFFFFGGNKWRTPLQTEIKKTQTNQGTPTTLGAKTQEIITQSYHKFGFGSQHK
jgi:hypothetical protein